MGYRVVHGEEALWRPSNAMGVANTDLAAQAGAPFGARLWRLEPGQANTRHRHREQTELYVLLEGRGRMRVDGDVLSLAPLSAVVVEPASVRQVFNDTDAAALWLVVGAPAEAADTRAMSAADIAVLYPDGLHARPPELG
jgi:quercetin dioxygenase-like cupin family protein